jgi:cytochrome c oxidase subunit II
MNDKPHFTTRRGFITAAGFGVVSLYGLWAAYGAAPLGIFGAHGGHGEPGEQAGHGGHGPSTGPSPEEFRKLAEGFVEAYGLPDGSVHPRAVMTAASHHATHAPGLHAAIPAADSLEPIGVYLMAYQWGFTPATLRLEANVPYRFRMMAVDVSHGAAIRIGAGSRIVRLRTGALVEQELRFTRPGEHLLYCTIYCGLLHDRMRATIIVA